MNGRKDRRRKGILFFRRARAHEGRKGRGIPSRSSRFFFCVGKIVRIRSHVTRAVARERPEATRYRSLRCMYAATGARGRSARAREETLERNRRVVRVEKVEILRDRCFVRREASREELRARFMGIYFQSRVIYFQSSRNSPLSRVSVVRTQRPQIIRSFARARNKSSQRSSRIVNLPDTLPEPP